MDRHDSYPSGEVDYPRTLQEFEEWFSTAGSASRAPRAPLVTPLITYAELNRRAGPGETWKMISFWKDVLDE